MIKIDTFLEQNKNTFKNGWVAYDNINGWQWFKIKPELCQNNTYRKKKGDRILLSMFAITPYDLPASSLRKIAFVRKDIKKVINPILKKE